MPTLCIALADDLHQFVTYALETGLFQSADELVAHALRVVRAQTPAPAGVIELTREGFDEPAFLAALVSKLEQDRRPNKPR
jgi:Arc/MetJ-type ribon-helix-helix transcriptional regulator